jgi:hypothetical protein
MAYKKHHFHCRAEASRPARKIQVVVSSSGLAKAGMAPKQQEAGSRRHSLHPGLLRLCCLDFACLPPLDTERCVVVPPIPPSPRLPPAPGLLTRPTSGVIVIDC